MPRLRLLRHQHVVLCPWPVVGGASPPANVVFLFTSLLFSATLCGGGGGVPARSGLWGCSGASSVWRVVLLVWLAGCGLALLPGVRRSGGRAALVPLPALPLARAGRGRPARLPAPGRGPRVLARALRLPGPCARFLAPLALRRPVRPLGRPVSVAVWLLGGSRSLPAAGLSLCGQLAAALAGAGAVVGCALGADQAFASAWRGPLVVCAAGSAPSFPLPAGAVLRAWAGGGPGVPLAARLVRRSAAGVALVASRPGAAGALFVLSSPASRGSLLAAAAAVRAGLPVWAFCAGFSGPPAPLCGLAGAWVPGVLAAVSGWRWQPAGVQPPLFG